VSTTTDPRWSPAALARLRAQGDPPIDALVTAAVDTGTALAAMEAFVQEGVALPAWADEALVRQGQAFLHRQLLPLNLAFVVGSLPRSYCAADGARLLLRTGRLEQDPRRRVFETALLLLHLAQPEGLGPGSPGHQMLRSLRWLHAMVRHGVRHGLDALGPDWLGPPWEEERHGAPVSQLELLGTLWLFAVTGLEVVEKAGIRVEEEDRAAWVHLWSVAGHLLGVGAADPTPLLPMAPAEAAACLDAITRRQFAATAEGRLLALRLVRVLEDLVPDPYQGVVAGTMRWALGEEEANLLGLPPAGPGRTGGRLRRIGARLLDGDRRRAVWGARGLDRLARALLGAVSDHLAGDVGVVAARTTNPLDHALEEQLRHLRRQRFPVSGSRARASLRQRR